ncbi:DeoR/GlpR family DNA-binding transcription regulator [Massilia pseudoviolaceinigra]|uniref:DeoR/GlpR family DNA-binding transcription regulator n=1 Tax=Massilia pseudoviolaceinigra TaxID=3057165 RepID=UPI002796BC15|nr:DeoR/GlpR family DNA-binding transcription regulator [Massilia sp. CCM 9206]MDQ1919578.1 DeoR/GlpR family DNA-binding transcription regulator [Massilia sp. CCM 9206]
MPTDPLLLQERHALILQRLQTDGRVLAPDLAQWLQVSEDTIRRDLRDLAAAGQCQKVYGGALRMPLPAAPGGTPAQRRAAQTGRKARLAATAAPCVAPGSVVFIDAGSTNLAIAAALGEHRLTVITNAPAVAAALIDKPLIELIVIGGRIHAETGASIGATALRELELISPDLYILGACGVDAQAGVSAIHFEEAEFKRHVASLSKTVLVATTNDKVGTAAPYAVLAAASLSTLVAEHDIDARQADAFAARGVRVLRAAKP